MLMITQHSYNEKATSLACYGSRVAITGILGIEGIRESTSGQQRSLYDLLHAVPSSSINRTVLKPQNEYMYLRSTVTFNPPLCTYFLASTLETLAHASCVRYKGIHFSARAYCMFVMLYTRLQIKRSTDIPF